MGLARLTARLASRRPDPEGQTASNQPKAPAELASSGSGPLPLEPAVGSVYKTGMTAFAVDRRG